MKAKKKVPDYRPVNIRLPFDLYSKAQELATKNDHSISKTVVIIMRKHFEASA